MARESDTEQGSDSNIGKYMRFFTLIRHYVVDTILKDVCGGGVSDSMLRKDGYRGSYRSALPHF